MSKSQMIRAMQAVSNKKILSIINELNSEIDDGKAHYLERLRTCSAWVYQSENFRYLRSYNTIIACIDFRTGIGYDFLRLVYGYTSTSSQHISKFMHDYGAQNRITWYPV